MKTLIMFLAFALLTISAQAQTVQPVIWSDGHPITVGGETHGITDAVVGAADSMHVFGRFSMVDKLGIKYDSIHVIISYTDSLYGTLYLRFYTNYVGIVQDTTALAVQPDGDGATLEFAATGAGFTRFTWLAPGLVGSTMIESASCEPIVVVESASAMASEGEKFSVAFIGYHKDRN